MMPLLSNGFLKIGKKKKMIKFRNSIRMIVIAAILPAVFSSCIGEEMMTCEKQILVQRIGEGGSAGTRGAVISSNTDLRGKHLVSSLP